MPRARSRSCGRPCRAAPRAARRRRARRGRRSSRCRRASRSSARGPTPGQQPHRERCEEGRLRPGRTTVRPPGLRRSEATFATTFEVATPERARQPGARRGRRPHGFGERARVVERRARPRRGRGSPRRCRPARRSAPSRGPSPDLPSTRGRARARAHEDDVRAAPQRLRAGHRRADPEAAGGVVRGRDHAAAVRVAADDQRTPRSSGCSSSSQRRRTRPGRGGRRSCNAKGTAETGEGDNRPP